MTIDGLRFIQIRTRSMPAACTTTGLQLMVITTTERVKYGGIYISIAFSDFMNVKHDVMLFYF